MEIISDYIGLIEKYRLIYLEGWRRTEGYKDYYRPLIIVASIDDRLKSKLHVYDAEIHSKITIGDFSYRLIKKHTYNNTWFRTPKKSAKKPKIRLNMVKLVGIMDGKLVMDANVMANPNCTPLYYCTVTNHPNIEGWKAHLICWDTGECIVHKILKEPKAKNENVLIPYFDKDKIIVKKAEERMKARKKIDFTEKNSSFSTMFKQMESIKTLQVSLDDIINGKINKDTILIAKKLKETFDVK